MNLTRAAHITDPAERAAVEAEQDAAKAYRVACYRHAKGTGSEGDVASAFAHLSACSKRRDVFRTKPRS